MKINLSIKDVVMICNKFPEMMSKFTPFILADPETLEMFSHDNRFVEHTIIHRSDVMKTVAKNQTILSNYYNSDNNINREKFKLFYRVLALDDEKTRSELLFHILESEKTIYSTTFIEFLIESGIDPNYTFSDNQKWIIEVLCQEKNLDFFYHLCDYHPSIINVTRNGTTPLHLFVKLNTHGFKRFENIFNSMVTINETNENSILRLVSRDDTLFNAILAMKNLNFDKNYDYYKALQEIFLHNDSYLKIPTLQFFLETTKFDPSSIGIVCLLKFADFYIQKRDDKKRWNMFMHLVQNYNFNYRDEIDNRDIITLLYNKYSNMPGFGHDFLHFIVMKKQYIPSDKQLASIRYVEHSVYQKLRSSFEKCQLMNSLVVLE